MRYFTKKWAVWGLLLCLLGCFSFVTVAQDKGSSKKADKEIADSLKQEGAISLACGLKFRGFKGTDTMPISPILIKYIVDEKTDEIVRYYDPETYWKYSQGIGKFAGNFGSLIIAEMKFNMLTDNDKGAASLNMLNEWMANEKNQYSLEDPTKWLQSFMGVSFKEIAEKNQKCAGNLIAKAYENGRKRCFVIESKSPVRQFAFMFDFNEKIPENVCDEALTKFFKTVSITAAKKKIATKVVGSKESILRQEILDCVQSGIENIPGWSILASKNYFCTGSVKRSTTIKKVKAELELIQPIYRVFFPPVIKVMPSSVCRLFASSEDCRAYCPQFPTFAVGIWAASYDEMIVCPGTEKSVEKSNSRTQTANLIDTVRHEGFHQYIFYALGLNNEEIWFNEGHATFFEGMEVKGNKATIKITDRYLAYKQNRDRWKLDVQECINFTSEQFQSGGDDDLNRHYAMVWLLTFYLHKGAAVKDCPEYHSIPRKYYEARRRGLLPKEATKEAWNGINMQKFQSDFESFWRDDGDVKKAERYDIYGEYLKKPQYVPSSDSEKVSDSKSQKN